MRTVGSNRVWQLSPMVALSNHQMDVDFPNMSETNHWWEQHQHLTQHGAKILVMLILTFPCSLFLIALCGASYDIISGSGECLTGCHMIIDRNMKDSKHICIAYNLLIPIIYYILGTLSLKLYIHSMLT